MTAFNVNTGGIVNWDTLTGGSVNATLDSYAISAGSTLLIDTDSFWCANHTAAFGSLDTVTFSGIGGELKISGKNVRVIPYNTGTGNVPAIGTTISQGGVSATLLGVWSGWQVEPTAAASAMPATGYIKVKNKTGGDFTSGALTGIGASATGADVVGWIEVRGADTATITVPRIGKFTVDGDWFELGTTNGSRGQVLPCPTTATVAGVFAGVQIETSAGSGVYEWYVGVGSLAAASTIPTDSTRGKIVWQTTSGIRIGSDGTNSVGYLPATGCKVRIPNVILTCCTRTTSGSGPRVLPNATLATRQEFVYTNAGALSISKAVCQWYATFSQAFSVQILDSVVNDAIVVAECASALDIKRNCVGPTQAQLNAPLSLTSCFAGGYVDDNVFCRYSLAASGAYAEVTNYITGVIFRRNKTKTLTNKANATTGLASRTQTVDCVWEDAVRIGGRDLHVSSVRPVYQGTLTFCETFTSTTPTTYTHYIAEFTAGTTGARYIATTSFPVTNTHPYAGLVLFTASYDSVVYSQGTFASPLNFGSANACGVIVGSGGNNSNIKVKRCYASNVRTGLHSFINSDTKILLENVGGDYADALAVAALNAQHKGCAHAGSTSGQVSVYGAHWSDGFSSATAGFIDILCNEPTALSAAECAITSGTPQFNSTGSLLATVVGQQVTWETPYWILGHTALANSAPTLTGTNTGNLTYEYQIDTGSGYSAWKTLSAANLNAESISASTGFKLKVRATCATANAGNVLTRIRILTVTTSAAQSTNQYALETATVNVTNLVTGSRVKASKVSDGTVLYSGSEISGAVSFTTDFMGDVALEARKASAAPYYKPWESQVTTVANATISATALQVRDDA